MRWHLRTVGGNGMSDLLQGNDDLRLLFLSAAR